MKLYQIWASSSGDLFQDFSIFSSGPYLCENRLEEVQGATKFSHPATYLTRMVAMCEVADRE